MKDLLSKLEDVERILRKYHQTGYLAEVSACKALLKKDRYEECLSRLDSPTWWGPEVSIAGIAFPHDNIDEYLRDMVTYEQALLIMARVVREAGIKNEDAQEWVYQWESWYDI